MLSTISGQVAKVLPAPEIACRLVTETSIGSNCLKAVRTDTYDWTEQFGFTAIRPLTQPRLRRWTSIKPQWSGFTSGMRIGTSLVQRCAELLDTTGTPAAA